MMKGKVPKRLRRHLRLVFRQEDDRNRPCEHPVRFGVRSGRKYLMFLERLGPARYAAVERPAKWSKHARRVGKKILCEGCGEHEFYIVRLFLCTHFQITTWWW